MVLFWKDMCLSVRTIQNANNWRNYLTEYLFIVDSLLKTKGLRYYLFLITLHKWFNIGDALVVTVTVNEWFFQSGIDEWIGDRRKTVLRASKSSSWLEYDAIGKLFKKSKYFIAVMFKNFD